MQAWLGGEITSHTSNPVELVTCVHSGLLV